MEQNADGRERSVNIEPVICNGQLPYPWEWHWREGRVGKWMLEGVGEPKHLGERMV